ncbi:hypothetical protein OOK29_46205 [Streptomyces phaeochromogenes]|nr:hypothetical protein [Streptomyces phaeochromogenes]MCX5605538.1 hypothetical protein [Streptomyces phaeochromogenes]WSJ06423.1 hypothetical protein OG437_23615 [Streptomyces phaeochromogenes]
MHQEQQRKGNGEPPDLIFALLAILITLSGHDQVWADLILVLSQALRGQ